MSIRAMNWAWGQPLAPTSKLILMALADAADDEGLCWPGIRTLASKCSVSGRTVQRTIKTFVNQGILIVEERRRPDGRQTSNSYLLALRQYPDNLSPPPLRPKGGGDNSDIGRVTQPSQGRGDVTVSPQEPPLNYLSKPQQPYEQCGSGTDIVFPRKLTDLEREAIIKMAGETPPEDLQQLVDELASVLASENTIRTTPLRWFQGVLRRYKRGEFVATGAIETAKRRLRKQRHTMPESVSTAPSAKSDGDTHLRGMRNILGKRKLSN